MIIAIDRTAQGTTIGQVTAKWIYLVVIRCRSDPYKLAILLSNSARPSVSSESGRQLATGS